MTDEDQAMMRECTDRMRATLEDLRTLQERCSMRPATRGVAVVLADLTDELAQTLTVLTLMAALEE